MSSHNRRKAVAARRAATGEKHTTALRALAEQSAGGGENAVTGPPTDRFGGHEFDYESHTDLFKCQFCDVYEVVARNDDGTITPCRGLTEWGEDTERVYLLLTQNPALSDGGNAHIPGRIRDGKGKCARYGYRDRRWLIESAPSVVDELERHVMQITGYPSGARADDPMVPAFAAAERLTADEGRQVIAANYAAYVAKYGEPRS